MTVSDILDNLILRYPILTPIKQSILETYQLMETCFVTDHKVLIAGNGGSAADAEHMVGELVKAFVKMRKIDSSFADALKEADPVRGELLSEVLEGGLPAYSLCGHPSLSTAMLNDKGGLYVFAQQVNSYGRPGDVLFAISTSGNSENIMYAVTVAKARGMKVIGLTGRDGGELANMADTAIIVPEEETYKIQELHLPIYHALCLMLEERFFE